MTKVREKSSLNDPVFSIKNKIIRVLWSIIYNVFFRFSPKPFFSYRRFILILFRANVGSGVAIHPSVKIWLPSNLTVGDNVAIGPNVIIYNQGLIRINNRVIISQGAHLCASTHDYNDPIHPLILSPILIDDDAWICADAFIGPSVSIGNGAVIGARTVMCRNAESWSVYIGNPAVKIKDRNRFS